MLNDLALVNLRKQTRDWESALPSWLTELGGYVKRAEARECLKAYLRDDDGVLVVDETGFLNAARPICT